MTTNESINNEVSFSDSQTEIQISSDSGIQTNDSSLEESKIIQTVEIHSTPILGNQNQKSDENDMLTRLYNMMYNSVEKQDSNFRELKNEIKEIKSSFNEKLDEQIKLSNDFDTKLEVQNNKFDELKNHMNEINKHLNQTSEIIEANFHRLEQSVEKLGDNVINITNINNDEIVEEVVLDNKIMTSDDNDINYNSESIVGVKNNGETNDENIIKNSTDEVLECEIGMLLYVYESERKWKELSLIHI